MLLRLVRTGLQTSAVVGGGYLALLTGGSFLKRGGGDGQDRGEPYFAVVVPAHNEESTVTSTLQSLEQLGYPQDCYKVFVVADNCSDDTAEVSRRWRCTVWERTDTEHRSKGYALRWAFERIPNGYDAVVVVDADTIVDPALLSEFARAYRPSVALQALNLQRFDSGLFSVASYAASAVQNGLKPAGREGLGFSVGLGGNGMCIPRAVLEEVPWARFGLAEDVEYHLDLVLSGKRVRFVPGARVMATAPGNLRGLQSQRLRWERGRLDALRQFTEPLLMQALKQRDAGALEALASMAVPPLNLAVTASVGCIALDFLRSSRKNMIPYLALAAPVIAILRALWLVRAPAKAYVYLPGLPLLVAWRSYISFRSLLRSAGLEWVRTERSGERA